MLIGRPEWMRRGHQGYDPNRIGTITQAYVIAALAASGKEVLVPCATSPRYDLVFEERGQFFRVQCKTGRVFRGAVYFPTHSLRAAKKETEWRRRAFDYHGQIDYFGVFCPDNGIVYLVPI